MNITLCTEVLMMKKISNHGKESGMKNNVIIKIVENSRRLRRLEKNCSCIGKHQEDIIQVTLTM